MSVKSRLSTIKARLSELRRIHLPTAEEQATTKAAEKERERIGQVVAIARAYKTVFYAELNAYWAKHVRDTREANERNALFLQDECWRHIIEREERMNPGLVPTLKAAHAEWKLVKNPPDKLSNPGSRSWRR